MDRNGINCDAYQFVFNAMTMLSLNFIHLRFYKPTGCPRKNVPLGEGQTSPKGTFFLGQLVYQRWMGVKHRCHNFIDS